MPNTLQEAQEKHAEWASTPAEAAASARQGLRFRDNNVPRVLRMAARYAPLHTLLANPAPASHGGFTQDRVRTLGDVLVGSEGDEIVAQLIRYTECVHGCWEYGLHDYMHLFDCNYGLSASGTVVFIDFGEVSSYTPFVRDLIVNQAWRDRFKQFVGLQHLLPTELHEKFASLMEARISPQVFDATWGNGLDDLDRDLLSPPALRDRPEEIPQLAERIIGRACRELGRAPCRLSSEAERIMMSHPWGPPVELDNVLFGAVQRTEEDEIPGQDLALP